MSSGALVFFLVMTAPVVAFLALLTFADGLYDMQARRLAEKADLALPPYIQQRVSGWLRGGSRRAFLVLPPLGAALALSGASTSHSYSSAAYPYVLLMLVFSALVLGVATRVPTPWPSGPTRLAHLRAVAVRQAFGTGELVVLSAGIALGGAAAGWGLWRTSAGPAWWAVCMAALALNGGATWLRAKAAIAEPSSARDILELGWDDLLRFRALRRSSVVAAWAPALFALLADAQLAGVWAGSTHRAGADEEVALVAFWVLYCGLALAFRRGDQRWRLLWEARRRPVMPWPPGPPTANASQG
jgi:hypothetical protein